MSSGNSEKPRFLDLGWCLVPSLHASMLGDLSETPFEARLIVVKNLSIFAKMSPLIKAAKS